MIAKSHERTHLRDGERAQQGRFHAPLAGFAHQCREGGVRHLSRQGAFPGQRGEDHVRSHLQTPSEENENGIWIRRQVRVIGILH